MIRTCSLEISKKLKEAGWVKETEKRILDLTITGDVIDFSNQAEIDSRMLNTPTISELLEELPDIKPDELFIIRKTGNKYDIDVLNCGSQDSLESLEDTLALL